MSTLTVQNIQGSSSSNNTISVADGHKLDVTLVKAEGSATTNLKQGLAKVWVNFDGSSVDGTADLTGVRDSFNVTSIVDGGTGDYALNINNDMVNTGYVVSGSGYDHVGTADTYTVHMYHDLTTGAVEINNARPSNNAASDTSYVGVSIKGDLA
tara:strand:- start:126 stop:587 length:462 start_codon:yes stop_codon:yes gene_type:complete